jgi:translation initiation factor IF-2
MSDTHITQRPPVVAIMGHIDHGKSTLLAYIKKEGLRAEAGGITQHISAIEVVHNGNAITFLDTPGHEAFSGIRTRGARVADIAVLVVSAEDGVKPQTIEALNSITESDTPYIVAITKVDKPEAHIERTKQSLAENNIYVEGYGGNVSAVTVSGKSGAGVDELLDLILLTADIENLTGDTSAAGTGVIIESNLDIKKGISATCIIKNGSLTKGMFVVAGGSMAPIRVMENWKSVMVDTATFSSPVKIIGWDSVPHVGDTFTSYASKKEAEKALEKFTEISKTAKVASAKAPTTEAKQFPLIIKADTSGSLEAILYQIQKFPHEKISAHVIQSGIGTISENDVRQTEGSLRAAIIGFNVKVDTQAKALAERNNVEIATFDVIYKLSEWLEKKLVENTPLTEVEEITGMAKVLKTFSKVKDKQILGCRMENGRIMQGEQVNILRRDAYIGQGRVKELQSQKNKISEVEEGKEFGTLVEAKFEIVPGDKLQAVTMVKK